MENRIQVDDLGMPLFQETPDYGPSVSFQRGYGRMFITGTRGQSMQLQSGLGTTYEHPSK